MSNELVAPFGTAGGIAPAPQANVSALRRPLAGSGRTKRSINWKLGRLVLVSVGFAVAVGAVLGLWRETTTYGSEKRRTLLTTAAVFGSASARAVAAGDRTAIFNTLRGAVSVPGVQYVAVTDLSGQVIVELGSVVRLSDELELDEDTADEHAWQLFRTASVKVSLPLRERGEEIGRIVLVSDTRDLPGKLWTVLLTAAAGALGAALVGLAIAFRLQRSITQPLLALTRTMENVQNNHDYSTTSRVETDDEIGVLATSFNHMIAEIREREREIVTTLVRAAEHRDTDTGEHVARVAAYVSVIAKGLGFAPALCDRLSLASTMHDIGKIGVPDGILLKPGPLTPDERAEMELHTARAKEILSGSKSDIIKLASEIAMSHHERWDGTGYPNRLAAEAIPIAGRIVAVADVFDALVSDRPYKKAWSLDQAKEHLMANAGSHFDPACVRAFVDHWDDVLRLRERGAAQSLTQKGGALA